MKQSSLASCEGMGSPLQLARRLGIPPSAPGFLPLGREIVVLVLNVVALVVIVVVVVVVAVVVKVAVAGTRQVSYVDRGPQTLCLYFRVHDTTTRRDKQTVCRPR